MDETKIHPAAATLAESGDLIDIIKLTTLFGEPAEHQDAIAAWTGDTCYATSGEPLPVWTSAEAADLRTAWREDAARIAAEQG